MSTEKPSPPADYECCESACSPRAWDAYYEAMHTWNAEQQASKEAEMQNAETEES